MGRGRKGLIEQGKQGKKASGGLRARRGDPTDHFMPPPKREEKKIMIQEDALELMKNMNQQELSIFFLVLKKCNVLIYGTQLIVCFNRSLGWALDWVDYPLFHKREMKRSLLQQKTSMSIAILTRSLLKLAAKKAAKVRR